MAKKVSVIIPTFNAESTIERAIDSVLNQDFTDFEIVVIDNGSVDNTLRIISQYTPQIQLATCKLKGAGPARNKGVEIARGQIIAFLDADDFWYPTKLSQQIKIHMQHSSTKLLTGCYANFIGKNLQIIGSSPKTKDDLSAEFEFRKYGKMPVPLSSWMLHKSTFEDVGGFNPDFLLAQDFEFLNRFLNSNGDIQVIRSPLCAYSIDYKSQTASHYTIQFLSAQFVLHQNNLPDSMTLKIFIQKHKTFLSRFYRQAKAGEFFRRSVIDLSEKRYFVFSFFIFLGFLLSPIRTLKKVLNQSLLFHKIRVQIAKIINGFLKVIKVITPDSKSW